MRAHVVGPSVACARQRGWWMRRGACRHMPAAGRGLAQVLAQVIEPAELGRLPSEGALDVLLQPAHLLAADKEGSGKE